MTSGGSNGGVYYTASRDNPTRSSGNPMLAQGTPFNIDELVDNLNDLSGASSNENELTPKQEETIKVSKLSKAKDIERAINLVNQYIIL
jgi:hypothetical protein